MKLIPLFLPILLLWSLPFVPCNDAANTGDEASVSSLRGADGQVRIELKAVDQEDLEPPVISEEHGAPLISLDRELSETTAGSLTISLTSACTNVSPCYEGSLSGIVVDSTDSITCTFTYDSSVLLGTVKLRRGSAPTAFNFNCFVTSGSECPVSSTGINQPIYFLLYAFDEFAGSYNVDYTCTFTDAAPTTPAPTLSPVAPAPTPFPTSAPTPAPTSCTFAIRNTLDKWTQGFSNWFN